MKKVFIILAFIATTTTAFASKANRVDRTTLNNFTYEFKGAVNPKWTVTPNANLVIFELNNKKLQALYTKEGELVGTSYAITVDALPLRAKRILAKKFEGYTITEAQRFELKEETAYFLSATKDNHSVIIKVGETGDLSIVKNNS